MIIQKLMTTAKSELEVKRLPVDPANAVEAFRKMDAVISSSLTEAHLDVAERMFERMLKHYGFTNEQIDSPLVQGLWKTIMDKRASLGTVTHAEDLACVSMIEKQVATM